MKNVELALEKLRGLTLKRKALESEAEKVNQEETHIRDVLHRLLQNNGLKSLAVDSATLQLRTDSKASIVDHELAHKYILETGKLELLQTRCKMSEVVAIADEQGEPPPGFSVTKETVLVIKPRRS